MSQQPSPEFNAIDAMLRSSAAALNYPRTPDIATRVRARLESEPYPPSIIERVRAAMKRPVLRVAAVSLLVAVVAVASALAIPQSREALADLFGLSSVKIEVGPVEGPPPPVVELNLAAGQIDRATWYVDLGNVAGSLGRPAQHRFDPRQ